MFQNLFAVLVPVTALFLPPPVLPAPNAVAGVGLRVERDRVTVENFSSATRWVVLKSGGFQVLEALAPHSNVIWECTEECLWDIDLQIADTETGQLHLSRTVSLHAALDCGGQTIWFGTSPDCWLETPAWLEPYYDGCSGEPPPQMLHVPVVRPSNQPVGDTPPVIEPKPLPPF